MERKMNVQTGRVREIWETQRESKTLHSSRGRDGEKAAGQVLQTICSHAWCPAETWLGFLFPGFPSLKSSHHECAKHFQKWTWSAQKLRQKLKVNNTTNAKKKKMMQTDKPKVNSVAVQRAEEGFSFGFVKPVRSRLFLHASSRRIFSKSVPVSVSPHTVSSCFIHLTGKWSEGNGQGQKVINI